MAFDPRLMLSAVSNLGAASGPSRYDQGFGARMGQAGLGFGNDYDRVMKLRLQEKFREKQMDLMEKKLTEMERVQKLRDKAAKLAESQFDAVETGPVRPGESLETPGKDMYLQGIRMGGQEGGRMMGLGVQTMQGPIQTKQTPYGNLLYTQGPVGGPNVVGRFNKPSSYFPESMGGGGGSNPAAVPPVAAEKEGPGFWGSVGDYAGRTANALSNLWAASTAAGAEGEPRPGIGGGMEKGRESVARAYSDLSTGGDPANYSNYELEIMLNKELPPTTIQRIQQVLSERAKKRSQVGSGFSGRGLGTPGMGAASGNIIRGSGIGVPPPPGPFNVQR